MLLRFDEIEVESKAGEEITRATARKDREERVSARLRSGNNSWA